MAPKKKLALHDFLSMGEGSSTNWADDSDDIVLPSGPGEFNPNVLPPFKRPQGGDFGGRDSFDSRPPRADVPFPTEPPYTAFIGNMNFDSSEQDIKDFFEGAANVTITSVRLISGFDGKPKGFAYAEFPEADMLRAALELNGSNLGGRNVRISVAEAPKGRDEGRSDGDWTRSGPLPDLPGRSGGGFGMTRNPATPVDSNRDWGDARGGRFTPSAPTSPALGSARAPMGSARPMGGFRERDAVGGMEGGPDRDWTAARGGRFTPSVPPTPSTSMDRRSGFGGPERRTSDNEARDWRVRASPASPALSDSSSGVTAAPAAPVERKKLQLAARSAAVSNDATSPPASVSSTASSKPNPFGAAAPVDTAAREQALLDARIEKERAQAEERRQKAEADAAAAQAKKSAPSPFGAAKPVDVSQREREVEEKLRKEKEDLANATKGMSEAKIAEEKSANPKKEWRRPSGPHAGLTNAQASAPQSQVAKKGGSSTTQGDATKVGAPAPKAPRQIEKNAGVRKEGFSYSNIARGGNKPPTKPIASDNIVPDNVPIKNTASPAGISDNTTSAQQAHGQDIKSEATATGNDSSEHMSQHSFTGNSVTEA